MSYISLSYIHYFPAVFTAIYIESEQTFSQERLLTERGLILQISRVFIKYCYFLRNYKVIFLEVKKKMKQSSENIPKSNYLGKSFWVINSVNFHSHI